MTGILPIAKYSSGSELNMFCEYSMVTEEKNCQAEDQIVVQLGIEEGDKTRLAEKMCMEDECMDIFYEFYNSTFVRNLESCHLVEFLCNTQLQKESLVL